MNKIDVSIFMSFFIGSFFVILKYIEDTAEQISF